VRRVTRRARVAALAAVAGSVGLALSACAAPTYRYIGGSDHDLVLRVPRSWSPVNTKDALKATGSDPSTAGWIVFYDAYDHPNVKHVTLASSEEPLLSAQTIKVPSDERASVTDDGLRDLILPGTAADRATATAAGAFAVLENKTEKTSKQEGVHLLYTEKIGTTNEYFDRIALTNPKKSTVDVVLVHCNQQCFEQQRSEIEDAVTSLTLKTN
jgi:hypothetical protein